MLSHSDDRLISDRPVRLGVIGWPVAHSRSPAIHNAALAAAGLKGWRYQLLPVAPGLLAELVGALPAAGFRGINITIPHKEAALNLATAPTDRARAIGAANTLVFEAGGVVVADNTDAPALLGALPLAVAGRSALVLGAGGSARAAVWALRNGGAEVRIWNRTRERADRLAAQLGASVAVAPQPADLLVNCTAVGLTGAASSSQALPVPADRLTDFGCVVDLVYADGGTGLIRAARERGVAAVDGLELLVRQGALSFELFTGRPAPLEVMRRAVGME